MSRNRLYLTLGIFLLAGYAWVGFLLLRPAGNSGQMTVCLMKNATGYPCPSCGTSRSVVELLRGHLHESLMINPLGLLSAGAMLVLPVWMLADVATNRQSFLDIYKASEKRLGIKWISIPLIVLLLINWYWNIRKNL